MTALDTIAEGAAPSTSSTVGESPEATAVQDHVSLTALAREMERIQVPARPRPPMVADPAAAATRDRGPTSRVLTVLRVSTDYLTPALMLAAAGVWLWALARAAEQLS